MCRGHELDETSQGLEAALGGALGVAAHRHGLVVLAGVLDIDVDELDAAARLRVRADQADGLGRGRGACDVAERDVLDGDVGGVAALAGAHLLGAVVLVDDDGVGHFLHLDVLEGQVGRRQHRLRVLVRLDAHAIGGALQHAVLHRDVGHVLLVLVAAEAADADALPGAAGDACHRHTRAPGSDGDAVVAGADGRVGDAHLGGGSDVDAVRVLDVRGRGDAHVLHGDVLGGVDADVEELGVEQPDAGDSGVGHVEQHQCLHITRAHTHK
jgi:hypothetical protein